MKPILSIIICTYNRPRELRKCIQALSAQTASTVEFQVIVINNGDHKIQLDLFSHSNITEHIEPDVGLSNARNHGAQVAIAPWLCFLDDDVIVPPDYIERVIDIISSHPFPCFGGPYTARFDYGRPNWLPSNFGNKEFPKTTNHSIVEGNLSGGNLIIKKAILLDKIGGFSAKAGMLGSTLGYGEEDLVQEALKTAGFDIGFFAELNVDHIVLPHKLLLVWHLKHAWVSGRFNLKPSSPGSIIFTLFRVSAGSLCKRLPMGIVKVLLRPDYYTQNVALEVLTPILFYLGKSMTIFLGPPR